MTSRAAALVSRLLETPMDGDPANPRYWQPGYQGPERQADQTRANKASARDSLSELFADELQVQPVSSGQFQFKFEHGGQQWVIRQTSNSVRVLSPLRFDVSGCPRELACKVIIATIRDAGSASGAAA